MAWEFASFTFSAFNLIFFVGFKFDLEAIFAVMVTGPKIRFSEEVLAAAIVQFYKKANLVPAGVALNALESWSSKMSLGLRKLCSKFRRSFSQAPTGAKLKAVAALKARLCEAGIKSLEPTPSEAAASTASHEDLSAIAEPSPVEEALSKVVPVQAGASQTAKKSVLDEGRRPVSTPARSYRAEVPAYVLKALEGSCFAPPPFPSVATEEEGGGELEGEVSTKKKPAKKGTAGKKSKAKKSKAKKPKEIAGPEEEKNLAVDVATVPLVEPVVNAESAAKPTDAVDEPMIYKPKEFAEARLNFIKIQRAQGLSFAEASKSWSTSEERADLLADLPVSELKRRRFI